MTAKNIVNIKNESELVALSIGTLLGDAWMQGNRLSYEHCVADKEYLDWKTSKFTAIMNAPVSVREREARDTMFKDHLCHSNGSFTNGFSVPFLGEVMPPLMYNADGKKVVTKACLSKLTPLAIMLWYFDDGSFNYSQKAGSIYTNGFTLAEHNLIKTWFEDTHGIKVNITAKSGAYCLYFKRSEMLKLFSLFDSCITDVPRCMLRKYPVSWKRIELRTTYKWNRLKYTLPTHEAKKLIKDNLLKYHNGIDVDNPDKATYFNAVGYSLWEDSYSISKAIRRIFGSFEVALVYASLPTLLC